MGSYGGLRMRQSAYNGYLVNDTVDIKLDYGTKEVVVIENGKEIFRKPRTEANIGLAHQIYMGAKYKEAK